MIYRTDGPAIDSRLSHWLIRRVLLAGFCGGYGMSARIFGTVCLALGVIFTLIVAKGILTDKSGAVLLVPALSAIMLVIVGISNRRRG